MIFSIVLAFLSVHKGSLSCRFHEQNLSDVEQILVQTFKKKLLNELGFSSVPNVSNIKAPRIPSFYKHLIEAENRQPAQTTESDDDDFHAKTERLFLFPDQGKIFLQRIILNFATFLKSAFSLEKPYPNKSRNESSAWLAGNDAGPLFPALEFCKHS